MGAEKLAVKPDCEYDLFTFFVPTIPSRTKRVPKPCRFGGDTAGPPFSAQFRTRVASSSYQFTSTRPSGTLNAPCLTALVANSCRRREIDSAAFGLRLISGPDSLNRAGSA